ncbi:uncharacterized protein LOC119319003 [Triticum dicoccoides]|uniref:uncharacterized protein LOC119319003 n=1 Tax=Triticum dicoccoides TaxID=85692 RepID=UPI0018919CA4|nr:uncharacterized protein LOC119319003 [Triticum dicoccoides]
MFKGGWQISLTDTRLLRSLSPLGDFSRASSIHIDIYPAATDGGTGSNIQGTSSETPAQVQPHTSTVMDSKYRDTLKDGPVAAVTMWDCPKICLAWWKPNKTPCIIRVIIHGQDNKLLEDAPDATTSTLLLPDFICEQVTSLHVYDNPSITSVPASPHGLVLDSLIWCRVERCPKLHTVFTVPQGPFCLETFWASQLLSAVYIWDKPVKSKFKHIEILHLDYCPRLVHVLPMSIWKRGTTFSSLETIEILYCSDLREIVYCGDLREVFPLGPEHQQQDIILEFPKLRHIHLHELPTLQCICGRRMSAPKLETIKIRGCWSLRRLPAVGRDTKPPKVDCEKEWWDNLEWDGLEKYQHPSLYEPSHSLYYKKAQLPRGTLLR